MGAAYSRRCSRDGSPRSTDPGLTSERICAVDSARSADHHRLRMRRAARPPYGERWTCEKCGETWNTRRIPLEEDAQLRRIQMRFRWMPLAVAAVVAFADRARDARPGVRRDPAGRDCRDRLEHIRAAAVEAALPEGDPEPVRAGRSRPSSDRAAAVRVIVVGAGFAGLAAADGLLGPGSRSTCSRRAIGSAAGSGRSVRRRGVERGAEFILPHDRMVIAVAERFGLALVRKGTLYGNREPRGGVAVSRPR